MTARAARHWLVALAAVAAVGCREAAPAVPVPDAARPRIVSFSPALTQILYDMGLGAHVVGVTRFCPVPAARTKPVVGGRRTVSTEVILNVEPDVVVIQQNPDDFGALRRVRPGVRIEHFSIKSLDDIAAAIGRLGRIAGRDELADRCRERFRRELATIRRRAARRDRPKVVFLIAFDRHAAAGRGTFVGEMIELAGGTNAAAAKYDRWANISNEAVVALAPDVLVCQTDPAKAAAAMSHWRRLADVPAVRAGRVHVVTETGWTIPSTRSAAFAAKLAKMIHPGAAPEARP